MHEGHSTDLLTNCSSHFHLCISYVRPNTTGKLSDSCTGCEFARMAAVPQGAFAARKVRQTREREAFGLTWQQQLSLGEDAMPGKDHYHHPVAAHTVAETTMEQPMQYSSKLMNSIWGLYNRYSVHNFKKNTDGNFRLVGEHQLNAAVPHSPIKGIFQNQ